MPVQPNPKPQVCTLCTPSFCHFDAPSREVHQPLGRGKIPSEARLHSARCVAKLPYLGRGRRRRRPSTDLGADHMPGINERHGHCTSFAHLIAERIETCVTRTVLPESTGGRRPRAARPRRGALSPIEPDSQGTSNDSMRIKRTHSPSTPARSTQTEKHVRRKGRSSA